MAELTGTMIGAYRLDSFLGRGGMSDVYLALHRTSNRWVALKLLRISDYSNGERRFLSEAQLMSNLDHPNIVKLYDFFESNGALALAIEYVPGENLDDILADRILSPEEALRTFARILVPIAYLHSLGVVHRDIKPGNIRITPEGEVKILDFGIARATGSNRLTQVGRVVGTAGYLSPEVRAGEEPRATADIWALGVLLKEMRERFDAYRPKNLPKVSSREEKILNQIQAGCLQRKPEARYRNAEDVLRELNYAQESTANGFPYSKRQLLVGSGVAVACVGAVIGTLLFRGSDSANPTVPNALQSAAPVGGQTAIPVTISTYGTAADIYIDGQLSGKVGDKPSTLQVAPGVHNLELKSGVKTVYGPESLDISTTNNYFNCLTDAN